MRLERLEELKGSGEGRFEVRIVGGRLGDRETRVEGVPVFTRGEECVLFLGARNRDGFPVVVHGARGKLRVVRRESGGRAIHERVTGLGGGPGRMSLDEFRVAVRRIAERGR